MKEELYIININIAQYFLFSYSSFLDAGTIFPFYTNSIKKKNIIKFAVYKKILENED